MIIDIHGHLSAPAELYAYKANLLAHRGAHGRGRLKISDDLLRAAVSGPLDNHGGISHLDHLDQAGIGLQLISPRPYTLMHSEQPASIVRWFAEESNNLIRRVCDLYPGRFGAIAGLPQARDTEPTEWVGELRRCVTELGFVGCLLNPDPGEGLSPPVPPLGDRYWYPLYSALCELDVPALIHSAGCRPPARESYSVHFLLEETIAVTSLMQSSVFQDFPGLKLVVSHGGGAVPYQVGRFLSGGARHPDAPSYIDLLRQLWFDTCLYTQDAIELLFKTIGTDRCLFGSEKPGTGSRRDPRTGRWFDDIHLLIDEVSWLSDAERHQLLAGNAELLFGVVPQAGPVTT
jgi:predicted TIM-barrel fold metal-dependent hydrolase